MKTILLFLLLTIIPISLAAQSIGSGIALRNLDGENVTSDEILRANQVFIMIFWRSNTKCCNNLDNMQSAWQNQLKDKGVKLIAICVDCKGTWSHVKPFVNGKEWEFDIYIDTNGDFKRAMGITEAPYTLLFDMNQKVICRSAGYCSGNEEFLCRKILHCLEETKGDIGIQANTKK